MQYPVVVFLTALVPSTFSYGEDKDDQEPLQCNFCVHSRKKKEVEEGLNQEPDCMNRLKFLSRSDLRRTCTEKEKYCVSTVTNLNGFFVMIDRDCAEECAEGCEERGYGLFYSECTRCCQGSLCNEFDGRAYYLPLAADSSSTAIAFIISSLFVLTL
ncbi:unnamed protein product [Caenorhabditis auriculariae]|uniref:Snake toxin/toxin-like domain-containing protein n=1 Tax=Caenorhabditis auriculariae TaxID=2777116 RepID=A0A8S1GNQ7_9PELO|nr:unnamed protein product [Caenorhabditis auriculariae]